MNILIVDDYPGNLRLLRAALESEGHAVGDASDGAAALQRLTREPYDAIISDVLMPTMDGFRLCREVRANPSLCSLPLVLYTSTYDSPTDRTLASSVGADAYILKPAPVATLLEAIAHAKQRAPASLSPDEESPDNTEILEQYNAALVRKLESRNDDLRNALAKLTRAHDEILELNRTLETRVQQRTSALAAANEELEAFSFSVSHDLRGPLRQITGFTELLEIEYSPRLEAGGLELLARIRKATGRMHDLIEGLLEFARTARSPVTPIEVDLEALLGECLDELQTDGRNIEWRRSSLPIVLGDATLMRQVLMNLLSNAVKYTRTRSRAVIEVGQRPGRAREAVIFVKDNGVGFDIRRTSELFGVFKRLHSAEAFEGTGVGLATVQRIVRRLGGDVWAEGSIDQGATFYFSLPQP